ncbi:MAG: trypsin-like peptidase domain-containing protein [Acidobacteriota bacterium]|nr:MAG: trypsin-like peptidase domain-containing protein [Acidobacteriota bacterium]
MDRKSGRRRQRYEYQVLKADIEEIVSPYYLSEIRDTPLVEVHVASGRATGFFINARGLLVTAEHAVSDEEDGDLALLVGCDESGFLLPARVIARDAERDLAVIGVDAGKYQRGLGFRWLELESDEESALDSVLPGMDVTVIDPYRTDEHEWSVEAEATRAHFLWDLLDEQELVQNGQHDESTTARKIEPR